MQQHTRHHSCEPARAARENSLRKRQPRLPRVIGNRMSHTGCADSLVEHGLETLLREGGTLQVLDGSDILSHRHTLRVLDRCHESKCQTRRVHASVIGK